MMICRHHDINDSVIFESLHTFYAASAAILVAEILNCHTLNVSELCRRDDCRLIRDHILSGNIEPVKSDLCSSVISVLVGNLNQLLFDHAKKLMSVGKNHAKTCDCLLQSLIFTLDLTSLQACQSTKTHINDSLCLRIGETESLDEFCFGDLNIFRRTNNMDDLVNIIERNEQALQNMGTLLSLVEVIFCAACHNIFLMFQVVVENLQKIKDLRLAVYQCKINDAECILQLSMFI